MHPLSIQFLQEQGYSTDGLQSQSWDDFADFAPDIVVTVCDAAANETCPVYFGDSLKVHWGLEDPSKIMGSDADIAEAFRHTIKLIEQRVQALLALTQHSGDRKQLKAALAELGAQ